jgi:hypothetical protein
VILSFRETDMTERDLETLIERGTRRMRAQHALRVALATFGITLLVAAAGILIVRWTAAGNTWAGSSLLLPVVATLAVLLADYLRHHPTPRSVAMKMDQTAGSAEHLVTWLELRAAPEAQLNELQKEFRTAQRSSTLSVCASMNPSRLMPFRWPAWTRAVWLAILFVLCALLMPERRATADAPLRTASSNRPKIQLGAGGAASTPNNETRVEPLSKRDMLALNLQMSNPNLTPEQKERLLKDLKSRLPEVPRSALPQEIQDYLNILERDSVQKAGFESKENSSAAQTVGNENDTHKPQSLPGVASIPSEMEKAFTTVREQYSDVKEELERYYKDIPAGKTAEATNPRRP